MYANEKPVFSDILLYVNIHACVCVCVSVCVRFSVYFCAL